MYSEISQFNHPDIYRIAVRPRGLKLFLGGPVLYFGPLSPELLLISEQISGKTKLLGVKREQNPP